MELTQEVRVQLLLLWKCLNIFDNTMNISNIETLVCMELASYVYPS